MSESALGNVPIVPLPQWAEQRRAACRDCHLPEARGSRGQVILGSVCPLIRHSPTHCDGQARPLTIGSVITSPALHCPRGLFGAETDERPVTLRLRGGKIIGCSDAEAVREAKDAVAREARKQVGEAGIGGGGWGRKGGCGSC